MWAWKEDAPFWGVPAPLHLAFYPELERVEAAELGADGSYDVLLLGGSVVADGFGGVGRRLEERLSGGADPREGSLDVRVHVLARRAHTTLDSLHKYRRVAGMPFDLVIAYHGINDVRANNCPPDVFRDDYSHYVWYRLVNALERGGPQLSAIPFTLRSARHWFALQFGSRSVIPAHRPRPEWRAFGSEIKTVEPFREHLEEICSTAGRRGQRVLLMTFVTHIPDDYTREAFERGELDYADHMHPTEMWGDADNVRAGVAAHNEVVRELAAAHDHVLLVDQDRLMPRGARWYDDACHMTPAGCERFVENVASAIEAARLLPRSPGGEPAPSGGTPVEAGFREG